MFRLLAIMATAGVVAGCTAAPPFDLAVSDRLYGAPIMRIASTMANLKCELWTAANDKDPMPQFETDIPLKKEDHKPPEPWRVFNLQNIFRAIEYVGEVQLMVDAEQTTGSSPSLSFPGLGSAAHPLTIGLDASVSEKGHRANTTYHSVDFERLVKGTAREQGTATPPTLPCGRGAELSGPLGIKDNLQMGLVASKMNDLSVWPKNASNSGVAPDAGVGAEYTVGQIHAVIDFTTTTSINGGPSWELTHFVGPNSGEGLFNHKRQALNQVSFTFLPICIRDSFKGVKVSERWEYTPALPQGTPGWANYLPPCSAPEIRRSKAAALGAAHTTNIQSLDNVIRLRSF
ncbi:hypothetical protein ACS4RR_026350 (plasmid) [Rhizobium sp. Z1P35]